MSMTTQGIVTWTTAHAARALAVPFALLFAMTACSDGGASPSFVDDGTVSRHGSLRLSPAQMTVREGDSVQVNASLVGGSAAFDASKVQWNIQPSHAGTVRGGYFVASHYGDVTLSASFSGASGSAEAEVLPAPRDVRELSASFFAGTAGQALPDSVAVLVTGRDGVVVSDVDVAFSVTSGGGTISPAVARTDAYGIARAKWTLGASTGRNELQAGIATVGTAVLEAEAYSDLSTALIELLEGAEQEGEVAQPLPQPVRVRVTDALGNPIRGITIEWAVPGDASESGLFTGIPPTETVKRTVSDAGGVAQIYWRLSTQAGEHVGSARLVAAGAQGSPSAAPGGNNGNGGGNNKTDFTAKAKPGHLTKINVTPDQSSTEVEGNVQLDGQATDKWGNEVETDLSWAVSDASIATVDGTGRLTGQKPGNVTVTATSGPASGSATATILSGAPASTKTGGSGQTGTVGKALAQPLTLQVLDAHGSPVQGVTVAWAVVSGGGTLVASSATTDANGTSSVHWTLGSQTGEQQAKATVSGTNLSAATYTATAEAPSIASITVSPSTADVSVGSSVTLQAVAKDATGKTLAADIQWSSSATGIATVVKGLVTGVAGGQAQIRATADGMTGTAVVTVGGGDTGSGGGGETEPTVALVQATPDAYTFTALGTSTQLSAVALDASGDPVPGTTFTWSSKDQGIASVDASGKVTAKAVGITSIIVCAAACSAADTVAVTVEQIVAQVEVTPATLSLSVGQTQQLDANVLDAGGYDVSGASVAWSSSNPSVASVSTSGMVTAYAAGDVVFRAESGSAWDDSNASVQGEGGEGETGGGSIGTPFFSDGFESQDLSLSTGGFSWGSATRTSIVNDDQYVVYPNLVGPISGRGWENGPASTGRHAFRFRYAAGEAMTEQRFSIGSAHDEIWASWWLKVPENFQHTGSGSTNNKLFMFWMDDYSTKGDGSTVGMEFRHNGSGGSNWYVKVSSGRGSLLGGDQGSVPFISYPSDQGRWMQIVVRIRAESSTDASDGVVQVWRRWEGQSTYAMTHDRGNQPIRIPASGPAGFSAGYLMGWANAAYSVHTEFLIDDFRLSTTSLLDGGP